MSYCSLGGRTAADDGRPVPAIRSATTRKRASRKCMTRIIAGSSVPQEPKPDEGPAAWYSVELIGVDHALGAHKQLHVGSDAGEHHARFHPAARLIAAAGNRLVHRDQLSEYPRIHAKFRPDRRFDDEIAVGHPGVVDICPGNDLAHIAAQLERCVVVDIPPDDP